MINSTSRHWLQRVAAGIGLVFLSLSPANAAGLTGASTFSLFLECNNDGTALQVGSSPLINGWQYASDARGDNTDGHFYDIAGMALKQTANDEVVVVLSGNTPLEGTGFDRQGNRVVWGDLFFTNGTQNFQEATHAGDLFGIRFASGNESGVGPLGVYNNVVGEGVGINNFGHRTLENYVNLIDNDSNHLVKSNVDNFMGDLQSSNPNSFESDYFDPTAPRVNVIGQGNKVGNDGFALLGLDDLLLEDFNTDNFAAAGDELIAFKFKQSALQYQPPLPELAADLEVDWIWDSQGLEPEADGFNAIDEQLTGVNDELARLKGEINPRNRANSRVRKATEGFDEVKAARDARVARDNHQKKVNKIQAILDVLEPKLAAWEAATAGMTEEEKQAYAAENPEAEWTRKDAEDLAYQQAELNKYQTKIAEIDAQYTPEQLAAAKREYNRFIQEEIRENPEVGPAYVQREQELAELNRQRKDVTRQKNGLKQERTDLENGIRELLNAKRQEVIQERVAAADEAARAEAEQEVASGGPRTSASGGIPQTEAEFRQRAQKVPENRGLAGMFLVGFALGMHQLRKRFDSRAGCDRK